jgi:hypothetical protein
MEEAKKLTLEEKRRRFEERLANGYYIRPAKPKLTPVLSLPVSEKIADAVKANPASLRVSARGENGIAVVDGPRLNPNNVTVRVDWVQEVDANWRPNYYDRGGLVSEYDPRSRLWGPES